MINDPKTREKPLNFHERTSHILPLHSNQLQETLTDLDSFTDNNLMKINEEKTKIMIFNTSRIFDFPPELTLPNSAEFLDVINCTKLLGIKLTTDLKWSAQTTSNTLDVEKDDDSENRSHNHH